MDLKNINLRSSFKLSLVIVLMTGLAACKSSGSATDQTATQADTTDSKSELEELYWARQDSARMNFTEADTEFMTGMIAHHAQALIMSRLAPQNGASPQIQILAARIINSQKDEIKSMQRWLRDRNEPVPEIHIDGLNLMIHGLGDDHMKMDHTNMVGMLSPEQLIELDKAQGKYFDELFLKYMIAHHQGAVTMVTKLFNTDGAAQDEAAFRLATDIQVDQRTEIARMQLMLDKIAAAKQ